MYEPHRRRFLIPVVLTLIAVPVIWWASQREDPADTAPADTARAAGQAPTAGSTSPLAPELVGDYEPVYLDGPDGDSAPGIADIAVPAQGDLALFQNATYSSALPAGICTARSGNVGERVNVVNLENNRSIICLVQQSDPEQEEDLVLSRAAFLQLADLTDAPIPVELRQ